MNKHQPSEVFQQCHIGRGGGGRLLVAAALVLHCAFAEAQTFVAQSNIIVKGAAFGAIVWGDSDRDGLLDILYSGNSVSNNQTVGYLTQLYRNAGNNSFTPVGGTPFTGGYFPDVAWGDFNRDGFPDLLSATALDDDTLPASRVWRNAGNNAFSLESGIALTGVDFSSVAWGDYDNDGGPDILLTGFTGVDGTAPISKVYHNNGNATFTDQTNIKMFGVHSSAVAWGDYDNDGYQDILLTGAYTTGPISKLYRNNGNGTFSENTSVTLAGISVSSAAWGDCDNDGDLDILIMGSGLNASLAKVYRNNGNGTFTDLPQIGLSALSSPSAAWGDYDNDGRLDILVAGALGSPSFAPVTKVFRNNGNNTFSEQANIMQPAVGFNFASAAWGDYDNDGRLDILLTGLNNTKGETESKIYRNVTATANTPPGAPTGLAANTTTINGAIRLAWQAASDGQTAANGLSYNLRVGTSPGDDDVVPCMANTSTGLRSVPALGNVNQNRAWTLRGLNPAVTYYWSVQAIDTAFAGGAWSTEASFPGSATIPVKPASQSDFDGDLAADLGVFLAKTGAWYMRRSGNAQLYTGAAYFFGGGGKAIPVPEDYNGDNQADFAEYVQNLGVWHILKSGSGILDTINFGWSAALPVPADYDGDGKCDLAVFDPATSMWFVRQSSDNKLMGGGGIGWGWNETIPVPGDYDGDGRTDLAVYFPAEGKWYIRQSSNNQMMEGAPIAHGWSAALPVQGDYDGDGRTDLAVYSPGDGKWYIRASSTGGSLPGSPFAWGASVAMPVPNDYDGDGKTDICVYVSTTGKWYIRQSHNGAILAGGAIAWGHPSVTPANVQYQTLKARGIVP